MQTPPRLAPDAPIYLVYNAHSGKGQAGAAHDAVRRGCEAGRRELVSFPISKRQPPREQARAAVAAARKTGGIVAVAGGDGTINAVAQAVLGSGCAFAVLPQGTFNYFGRTHGIPTDTEDAVRVLLTESPVAVQVGVVNERVFLVNASLGLYATLLEEREAFKSAHGRNRFMAFCAALLTLLRRHRPWNLRLSAPGAEEKVVRAASLFVGNNALQFEQVGVTEGEALQHGKLAAVVIRARGVLSQLGLLMHGMAGKLEHDDDVQTLSFETLLVEAAQGSRRSSVKVAADGEIERMQMPLRFSVAPEPLWLIKPVAA